MFLFSENLKVAFFGRHYFASIAQNMIPIDTFNIIIENVVQNYNKNFLFYSNICNETCLYSQTNNYLY